MPTSLGISVGASGVGSALRVDTATGPTTEFRRLTAESESGRGLGDLVFDAVSLVSPTGSAAPDPITVAYRTAEQATEIRVAAERAGRMVRLVPETSAVLAYLHTVGVRREPGTIGIVDVGASGTTVSVLDRVSGTVLRSDRTELVGGRVLGARVFDHVRQATERLRIRGQIDPDLLAARCQGAQEALSSASTTRIDITEAGPRASVTLTRSELNGLTEDLARAAAEFTRRVCTSSSPTPHTLALLGGAAASPVLAEAVASAFDGEIVTVPEPGAAAAIGAALLGESASADHYPLVGSPTRSGVGSSGRVSGVLAGVLVLSAVLAGFVTQHFTDHDGSDTSVSPLLTSGAVPDEEPATSAGTGIPSDDPEPEVATDRTDAEDYPAPTTIPWPESTWTPSTTVERPSTTSSTTVTPTPIDQVPTPEFSPENTPMTRPPRPDTAAPGSQLAPPGTTTPGSELPGSTGPATPPSTTEPGTDGPDGGEGPDPSDTTTPPSDIPTSGTPSPAPPPASTESPSTSPEETSEEATADGGTTEPSTSRPWTAESWATGPMLGGAHMDVTAPDGWPFGR